jgi:hypothetical protein
LLTVLLPGGVVAGPESPDETFLRIEQEGVVFANAAEDAGALGIYRDDTTDTWVASFPRGSTASVEDVNPDGLRARVETRDVSLLELDEIADRLQSAHSRLPAGTEFGFWVDPRTGTTMVEGSVAATFFSDLVSDYAGKVEYTSAGDGSRLSRDADAEPHNGGATIISGGNLCTSGFTVRKTSDGKNYHVTAGHCFGLSHTVVGANNAAWGTVQWRAPFPTRDMELIGGRTYDGWIYTGGEVGVQLKVVNAADPLVNSVYCSSGTISLEHCNHTVNSLSATYCDEEGCTANLVRFTNGNLLANGDSGGPFYFKNANGTLAVRGTLIAKINTNGYAHKWTTIRDNFGVTIVLG